MISHYTRACNCHNGIKAQNLIKKKLALPLCGNKSLAFDHIEILSRKNKSRLIHIKKIGIKGISLGNVGSINILNKYTLTRPAKKITMPDPKIDDLSLLISLQVFFSNFKIFNALNTV